MADTSNLSQFLTDVADAIRTKKETVGSIPAANFDTEILSIQTGIDTSDANAMADNIEFGKTAYVNGEKITGSITTTENVIVTAGADAVISDTGSVINVDRGYGKKFILNADQKLRSTIPYETIANIGGITGDKIVKGEEIYGVEGTAEGGGSGEVINALNDVIVFDSMADAEAYTDFSPGDKAVIFDTVYVPLDIDTWLNNRFRQTFRLGKGYMGQDWYVNNTVTLPRKITFDEYVEATYPYLTKDFTGRIQLTMTETSFTVIFNWNTVQKNTYVWSSADGLTYTFSGATTKGSGSTDEYIRLNAEHDGTIMMITSALENMAHIRYVNLFFSTRCTSAINGIWYVDPANDLTGTNGDFYPFDLAKCKFKEHVEDLVYALKKELVLFNDKVDIYNKFITYPGEGNALYYNLYEIDGVYYCGRNCHLYYSIETDKYYIGASSNEYILQKYDASTNTTANMAPIFTTTAKDSDGNTSSTYYYYLEVPKTAIVYPEVKCSTEEEGIMFYEYRVYVCENISANATHISLYQYPLSGIYSSTELHKSDFGAYINPEDIVFGKTAIGNDGFIQGTLVIPDVTQTEVDDTISILNEILGGEA